MDMDSNEQTFHYDSIFLISMTNPFMTVGLTFDNHDLLQYMPNTTA
tara:strand:- start:147 stop:284 length:138 start_codon:yes stop_codon:yes gene_type:complete